MVGPFGKAFLATNGVIFAIAVFILLTKFIQSGTDWVRQVDPDDVWLVLRHLAPTLAAAAVVASLLLLLLRWLGRRGTY